MKPKQLQESPEQLMLKNFDPEIRKVLSELGVKKIDYGHNFIDFSHKGYEFRIEVKQLKH